MTTAEVRRELHQFANELHRAGFRVGDAFDQLGDRAVKWAAKIRTTSDLLEETRNRRDDLRTTASGAFTHDAFGGSAAELNLQLHADVNDYRKARAALNKAKKKGLDGPLAEELAKSGNLTLIQEIANMSRGEIARTERLLASRNTQETKFGTAAVALSGLNKEIGRLNHLIAHQTRVLNDLEQRVESGAHRGTQAGVENKDRQRNRDTASRVRVGR